jgi:hypothetical protein
VHFLQIILDFFFPYFCCGTMPELGKKLKKLFFCRKQQQVLVPISINVNPATNNKRTGQTGINAH